MDTCEVSDAVSVLKVSTDSVFCVICMVKVLTHAQADKSQESRARTCYPRQNTLRERKEQRKRRKERKRNELNNQHAKGTRTVEQPAEELQEAKRKKSSAETDVIRERKIVWRTV